MSIICYTPETFTQLSDALRKLTPKSKIISGGTDLTIALNREPGADALVYMGKIKGIRDIVQLPEGVSIGAMASMADLTACGLLTGPYAALKHAASDVGSAQIRNIATIGGNIGTASPAGDLAPVLCLLGAMADIITPGGNTRRVPVSELITGAGKTLLEYNEAIVGVIIPKVDEKISHCTKSAFCKLGYRKAVTVSRIGLAVSLTLDQNHKILTADIVAGAIAPVPVHVEKAEQSLIGKEIDIDTAKIIGMFLSQLIMEITPIEFDRDYKARAAFGIAEDVLHKLTGG